MNAAVAFHVVHEASLHGGLGRPPKPRGGRHRRRPLSALRVAAPSVAAAGRKG